MNQGSGSETGEHVPSSAELVRSRVGRPWPGIMGGQRRRRALLVTLLALATFVTPFITTTPKVLGQGRWSLLQVAVAVSTGKLPLQPGPSKPTLGVHLLLGCGVVYLLLIAIAAAIVAYPWAKFIGAGAAAGCAVLVATSMFHYPDLQEAIYGAPPAIESAQVNAGTLSLTLSGLLLLLIVIAASKDRD